MVIDDLVVSEFVLESDAMYDYGLCACETGNYVLAAYTRGLMRDRFLFLLREVELSDEVLDYLVVNGCGLELMIGVYQYLEDYKR